MRRWRDESVQGGLGMIARIVGAVVGTAGAADTMALDGRPAHPYALTLIETFGGRESSAAGVNESGVVVGSAADSTNQLRAFEWENGVMRDLGTPGGPFATATGVNDAGEICGWGFDAALRQRAVMWRGDEIVDLGTFGGDAQAFGINNISQVTGHSWNGAAWHAFIWDAGLLQDLGTLGGRDSVGNAINDSGEVAGFSDLPSFVRHGFVWSNGGFVDLGTLGGAESFAYGINAAGVAVGTADTAATGRRRAFAWDDGVMKAMRALPGDRISWAFGVNDAGTAVGYSYFNDDPHGEVDVFAVRFDLGTPVDLNALAAKPNVVTLEKGSAISESGWIIGTARIGSGKMNVRRRGFVLQPVPGAMEVAEPLPGIAGESNIVNVSNVTPGAAVRLVVGVDSALVPVPWCTRLFVAVIRPTVIGPVIGDAAGNAVFVGAVPPSAGGRTILFQAVEVGECRVSDVRAFRFE